MKSILTTALAMGLFVFSSLAFPIASLLRPSDPGLGALAAQGSGGGAGLKSASSGVLPASAMNNIYHSLSPSTPFEQDWSDTSLILLPDDWTFVTSILGYLGNGLVSSPGVDPQTILGTETSTDPDVLPNQTNTGTTSGGVAEFEIANPVVALQGSSTADAPSFKVHLNTTGCPTPANTIQLSYNLRDIDGTADNAVQPIAVHYRTATSGSYTNLPEAFVADATTGPSLATLVTPVSVTLPAVTQGKANVQVRFMTSDAVGNDEWVGIDDISISCVPAAAPEIDVTPLTMSFGSQPQGSTSGTRSVTISNTGSSNLNISTLVKSGSNSGDFTITTDPSNTAIAPSGSTKLRVTFTPGGEGNRTAQISIPSNDADEPSVNINLSGTGTPSVTPDPVKSLWVWGGTPNPVTDATGRANLIARADANGITDLYVSVRDGGNLNAQGWSMYPAADVAALIAAAHSAGMKVWYATGDPAWQGQACAPGNSAYTRMQEVGAYNNFVAENEKFDGVMVDVEPGVAFDVSLYVGIHQCYRSILDPSVKLGTAINAFWEDPVEYPTGGETKTEFQHIIDNAELDQIVVMGYRDNAGASGGNGIIGLDEDEIAYASSIGKTGLVLAGLETKDVAPAQPENVTFFEEGNAAMTAESALVASHFSSSIGFGGFSIHAYQDEFLSGVAGWPVGPTAAPASISGRVMTRFGAGVSGVTITVQDLNGMSYRTVTTSFGYYSIGDLEAGQTYVVTASSRRYRFASSSQVVSLDDNVDGINFIASP